LDGMHDADFVVDELARPSGSGHGRASLSAVGLEPTFDHQRRRVSTARKRTSESAPVRGGDACGLPQKQPIRRISESHHAFVVCRTYRNRSSTQHE
jgi:hypothetical protein